MRSFDEPDEVIEFGGVAEQLVSIGGLTVARGVQPPGWRWSMDFKPLVGGEWCQAHHVGVQLSGRQAIELDDGTMFELGAWRSLRHPSRPRRVDRGRRPVRDDRMVGDAPLGGGRVRPASPRDLALHRRGRLHRHRGPTRRRRVARAALDAPPCEPGCDRAVRERQVATTGDGVLAAFDAARGAIRCATAIRESACVRGSRFAQACTWARSSSRGRTPRRHGPRGRSHHVGRRRERDPRLRDGGDALQGWRPLSSKATSKHELKGVADRWRLYRVVR